MCGLQRKTGSANGHRADEDQKDQRLMSTARKNRIAVQAAFLVLFVFLFLQTESKGNDDLGYPVKLFLDFDPLILITTLLSAHAVAAGFLLSIIVHCCNIRLRTGLLRMDLPLGTLNNMVGSLRRSKPRISPAGIRQNTCCWRFSSSPRSSACSWLGSSIRFLC